MELSKRHQLDAVTDEAEKQGSRIARLQSCDVNYLRYVNLEDHHGATKLLMRTSFTPSILTKQKIYPKVLSTQSPKKVLTNRAEFRTTPRIEDKFM